MKNRRRRFFQQSDTTRFASECSRQYVPLPERIAETLRGEEARARGRPGEEWRKTVARDRMLKTKRKIGAVDLHSRHGIVIRRSSYLHGEEAWSEFPRSLTYSVAFLDASRERRCRKMTILRKDISNGPSKRKQIISPVFD